jgi:hypothetical protein
MTRARTLEQEMDELMHLVAQAFELIDPVPEGVVPANFSYADWASPEADIAMIVDRSREGALVRGGVDVDQTMLFRSEGYEIELTITDDSIVGRISPPIAAVGWFESLVGRVRVEPDEHGEFFVRSTLTGPVRLKLESADRGVVNDWFSINRNLRS